MLSVDSTFPTLFEENFLYKITPFVISLVPIPFWVIDRGASDHE